MEHKIKPHKGGRSERININLTPEIKEALRRICAAQGISIPDWITKQVEASANPGAENKE